MYAADLYGIYSASRWKSHTNRTQILVIWAILAEKNEIKVDINQDESLTDLQILIKNSILLNFLHELVMYYLSDVKRGFTLNVTHK